MNKPVDITETTRVPLFTVIGAIPITVGFIFWLSVIYLKADAAQDYNEKQDIKIEMQNAILLDIRDRIIRIEESQKKNNN